MRAWGEAGKDVEQGGNRQAAAVLLSQNVVIGWMDTDNDEPGSVDDASRLVMSHCRADTIERASVSRILLSECVCSGQTSSRDGSSWCQEYAHVSHVARDRRFNQTRTHLLAKTHLNVAQK